MKIKYIWKFMKALHIGVLFIIFMEEIKNMEANNQKIEIKTNGAKTEIFVDGHKLNGVRSYRLEHGVGNRVPTLTLDLNALNLSVDGEMLLRQEGFGNINIEFKDEE